MAKIISDPIIKFFVSIIGIVVIFVVLKELQHIFIPLVIAYFLFFIFEPLNNFLKEHKVPYGISIILNLAIVIGLLFGISRVIIDSFTSLGSQLPFYEQKLNSLISTTAKSFGVSDPLFTDFEVGNILSNIDYSGLAGGLF